MVLLSGSLPIATLVVSACSLRCCSVPPSWKFLEKSYCQFMPNIVLRCILKSVFDSSETLIGVPASMRLWLSMRTSPAE